MNSQALNLKSPGMKKKLRREVSKVKLRNAGMAHQITDGCSESGDADLGQKSNKNKRVHFSVKRPKLKQASRMRISKPLTDMTRKLIEMTAEDMYLDDITKATVVNGIKIYKRAHGKTIKDEGNSSSLEVGKGEESLEVGDSFPTAVVEQHQVLRLNEVSKESVHGDGNSRSMNVGVNETSEDLSNDGICKTDSASTLDRFEVLSCSSQRVRRKRFSDNKPRKGFSDNEPLVVVMDRPAPKHYLMAKPTSFTSDNVNFGLPFPCRDFSNMKLPLEDCSENTTLRNTVCSFYPKDSTSVDIGTPYIFHILSNDKVLLGMKNPNVLFFRGKLSVSVVFGTVEVLGYEIADEELRTLSVYSPRGMSLLGLQAYKAQSSSVDWNLATTRLSSFGVDVGKIDDISSRMIDIDSLLLLENCPCPVGDFINVHFPLKLFYSQFLLGEKNGHFQKVEEILQCKFVSADEADNLKLLTKRSEWDSCFQAIIGNGKTRVMVCGGKSVGKSTFLRFLVNKSLSRFKEVLYLDFDPGQCEFSVPGCVSAVLVQDPLLGPNYFHLHPPEKMVYVGDINISHCPVRYLQCVQHIIEFCHSQPQYSDIPWFVNTMGFNKGLGVELTVNVIRMVGPSDVIQIQSRTKNRNFPSLLNSTYVCDYESSLSSVPSASFSDLAYNFHELSSAAEDTLSEDISQWGLDAKKLRDLLILSYLSQMLMPNQSSLVEVVPFRLPFSKLKLCVCHEAVQYSQYLSAMNCNLVALCSAGDEDDLIPSNTEYPRILLKLPVCPCLGFGIVRGVDLEAKEVFLISSLTEKELSQVNCLVLGPVSLPDGVICRTKSISGHIPYVTAGDGQPTGQNLRRSRSVSRVHKKR